ncbi:hypothetical protein QYF36_010870 [Acer negundo]|nr:hypothetical protein QYF36_010870 [Acer negundo]
MQVSYGRNGGGLSVGGKNSSNVGSIRKFSSVVKVGNGSHSYGGEISGKIKGNRRMMGKASAIVSGRKFVNPTKNGKLDNSVSGGSKFAVLSDIVDEDSSTKKVPSKFVDKVPFFTIISPSIFLVCWKAKLLCRNQWNVCKENLIKLVVDSFNTGYFPFVLNQTLISLVPKVPNPLDMTQLRPISLCNMSYKVISKIIVQRLRNFLPKLVNLNQVTFVPGRQIQEYYGGSRANWSSVLKHVYGEGNMLVDALAHLGQDQNLVVRSS